MTFVFYFDWLIIRNFYVNLQKITDNFPMKVVEYKFSRLCFKADVIEPLGENDTFIVHTPEGSFRMTKSDFYRVFPNVPKTKSYQEGRLYSCKYPPKRALQFLIDSTCISGANEKEQYGKNDLIGEEIREKIREIGVLWHTSEHNPSIDEQVLLNWDRVLQEWIQDDTMPLIVRKETNRKGQSFIHSCGREVIISDNTFAIWVYGRVMKGEVYTLPELKEMLYRNEIPMVFMKTNDVKEKAKYTKPLGPYSLPEWKLCHIEPIGFNTNKSIEDLDVDSIKEHFMKYANPNNMFVLPKEIGDLGEISIFIDEQRRIR